jgi:hypothetical protein
MSADKRLQSYHGFHFRAPKPIVSPWRWYVDQRKDYIYGWQAMDYLVNVLLPNSLVREVVKNEMRKLRMTSLPSSILCLDSNETVFPLDHWAQKVARARRLVPKEEGEPNTIRDAYGDASWSLLDPKKALEFYSKFVIRNSQCKGVEDPPSIFADR